MNTYLSDALRLVDENAYRLASIDDWQTLRSTLVATTPADDIEATYTAIEAVLARLKDNHSFFVRPRQWKDYASAESFDTLSRPRGERLGEDMGYVELLNLRPGSYEDAYAEAVQEIIRGMASLTKWVVDLRRNGGGNMFPMLAGVGPLLGEGVFGGFVSRGGTRHHCAYRDGASYYENEAVHRVNQPVPPLDRPRVAVLCGSQTASAGENVLIAFTGRPNTRTFGEPTAGQTIGNSDYTLDDGAKLILATSATIDRHGVVYESAVQPDVLVVGDDETVLKAALDWLHAGN